MPTRIQRRRTKGWRMPEGAVYVGRGSRWGNPFQYRTPAGLVRYRPDAADEWEYEGRISADGMRHDYFHPDGHVTAYHVRYATVPEILELYRRALVSPDRGMVGAYPSNNGHLITYRPRPGTHPCQIETVTPSMVRTELAGRDLACWCPLDQPCHADVLLSVANPEGGE